jgi:hypothetical protein
MAVSSSSSSSERWKSTRPGSKGNRGWGEQDITHAAAHFLCALPEAAHKIIKEGVLVRPKAQIIKLESDIGMPTTKDIENNFTMMKAAVTVFPTITPTSYYYADIFIEVDRACGGKFLQGRTWNEKKDFALLDGDRLKKVHSKLRILWRQCPTGSHSEAVAQLKELMQAGVSNIEIDEELRSCLAMEEDGSCNGGSSSSADADQECHGL